MLGWYFSTTEETLRHGDDREIVVGATHTIEGTPILCERGLHASSTIYNALQYAPGPILWRVKLSGIIVHDDDKSVATERTYLARLDATDLLRRFTLSCAADVIHLWGAPEFIKPFIATGDESMRAAAPYAAWIAARDAAGAACAARNAARNAALAAAKYEALDAAIAKQSRRLAAMVSAAMRA